MVNFVTLLVTGFQRLTDPQKPSPARAWRNAITHSIGVGFAK